MTISKAPATAGNVADRRFIFRLSDVGVKTEKTNTEDKNCLSSFLTFSQILWVTSRVRCQPGPGTHLVTFDLWLHPPRWLLHGAKIHTCNVRAQQPFHSPFAVENGQTMKKKDINCYPEGNFHDFISPPVPRLTSPTRAKKQKQLVHVASVVALPLGCVGSPLWHTVHVMYI